MICSNYQALILETYKECNTHLRDQVTQRNAIQSFYIALLVAFITLNNIIGQNNLWLFSILYLVGILCLAMCIRLRQWHLRYLICCQVINYIFTCDREINKHKELCKAVEEAYKSFQLKPSFKSFIMSAGNINSLCFMAVTAVPLIMVFCLLKLSLWVIIPGALLYIILLGFLIYSNSNTKRTKPDWILNYVLN